MPEVTAAKTRKKKVKKSSVRRKTKKTVKKGACAEDGCRRRRANGSEYCKNHLAENPESGVTRLERIDALKFGKIDAELRNAVQGKQIADFKIAELQQVYQQRVKELKAEREQLGRIIESQRADYLELVKSLADKYGIDDVKQMTIDPDNGIVRDLRKQ
jgi:hypothetical protein